MGAEHCCPRTYNGGIFIGSSCCSASIDVPPIAHFADLGVNQSELAVRFTAETRAGKNVLALVSTEPYENFPSAVQIDLGEPMRLEKIYLLTMNLAKTMKTLYPHGEVVVHYADGTKDTQQLVPPVRSERIQSSCQQPDPWCVSSGPLARSTTLYRRLSLLRPLGSSKAA